VIRLQFGSLVVDDNPFEGGSQGETTRVEVFGMKKMYRKGKRKSKMESL
jgi:hypothetical protein